jgi:tetratricopeptide (TPR) repeat protein
VWLLHLFPLQGLHAQGRFTPYTIYGRVTQPDSSPAPRAVVKITNRMGFDREVNADEAGRYEISELPRGRYYLTAVNHSAPDQLSDPVMVELSLSSPYTVSALIYLHNKDTKPAQEEKKAAVISLGEEKQDAPKPARKAFDQAMVLRSDKKYDESLKKFSHAIELFPSYFQALAERGHLLITMSDIPGALKDFGRALELNPHYGPALRGAGMCKFQAGKYAEAIPDLEQAANAEPGNAVNYYLMGIAYVALDRRDQGRAALQKALSLDPIASVRAHVHLATLLIRENRPIEAAQEIESYLGAVPDAPDKQKLQAILAELRAGKRSGPVQH